MIEVLLSECCGSPPLFETGLCSSCKEHADFTDIEKTYAEGLVKKHRSKKEKETKEKEKTNG
jgi:hypothetical protein|tara:strand:+ start:212 stop:397 length:186 start_codon:yes stop_codon:yes gene_type:complete